MGLIVLLAISVSLDTLGVGMAYAMSGIRIPVSTKVVIAFVSGLLTTVAVAVGQHLGTWIPDILFRLLGGSVLLFLGGKTLWNALGENTTADYDRDGSRILEPWEGMVLGITLTLDSISAGLGIRGIGNATFWFPLFTAVASVTFLTIGSRISCNLRRMNGIAGLVLITLAVLRFLFG